LSGTSTKGSQALPSIFIIDLTVEQTLRAKTPTRLGAYAGIIALVISALMVLAFRSALESLGLEFGSPDITWWLAFSVQTILAGIVAAFILSRKKGGIKSTTAYAIVAAILATIAGFIISYAIDSVWTSYGNIALAGFLNYLIGFAIVKHYNKGA